MQHLLTVFDVADLCRVTDYTVRTWIREGKLDAIKLGTGERSPVRVHPDALEAFFQPYSVQVNE